MIFNNLTLDELIHYLDSTGRLDQSPVLRALVDRLEEERDQGRIKIAVDLYQPPVIICPVCNAKLPTNK